MHHAAFRARWSTAGRGAIAVAFALAGGITAGAAPATAQTISVPPCVTSIHGPTLDESNPQFPVHGDGWAIGRVDAMIQFRWPEGLLNRDGTRAEEIGGSLFTPTPSFDGGLDFPDAIDGGTASLPPGSWPFTLNATSIGTPVPQSAQTTVTAISPGVSVQGVPRVTKKRGIIGRSKLALWGVDPSLNGRTIYGHITRVTSSARSSSFRAGVADADPCTPVNVPGKVKLLARKAGFRQYVRFSDTKKFKRSRDIPVLSMEIEVNAKGRARSGRRSTR